MSEPTLTRRTAVTASLAAAGAAAAPASPGGSRAQLLRRPYQPADGGETREHYLYVPAGFHSEPGKRWPVMLFLHGNGERGDGREDLQYTLIHGPVMEAWIQGRDLPFLIIQPQLPWFNRPQPRNRRRAPVRSDDGTPPPRNYGSRPTEPMVRDEPGDEPRWEGAAPPEGWEMVADDLLAMVDATLKDFRGDPERVYLTGLSYGGYGTWHMASAHPGRWAAVAPICGSADNSKVQAIADAELPIWIFQGGRDGTVKTEWVIESARALEAAGHPEVRLTVHEDLGHNVWTRVYEGWDLYQWFLRRRRNS